VAWLDTVVTAGEGILLWSGRAWGEWVVIAVLAGLLPVEVFSLLHRPSPGKWPLLGVNTAMVVYLVRRRLHCAAEAGKDGPSSNCAPRSRR